MEELASSKEEAQCARIELAEATQELSQAKETMEFLKGQLEKYLPKTDAPPSPGGKTLFSEVDDRRANLVEKHSNLAEKHKGLLAAHNMTVQQKERLRNHIDKLNQLQAADGSAERIRRLEQSLAQANSEIKALNQKITQLEDYSGPSARRSGTSMLNTVRVPANTLLTQHVTSLDAKEVQVLQLQLNNVTAELESAKKEMRASHMMRLHESDMVRRLEASLSEKEEALTKAKRQCADLRWKLDEIEGDHPTEQGDLAASLVPPIDASPSRPLEKVKEDDIKENEQDNVLQKQTSPVKPAITKDIKPAITVKKGSARKANPEECKQS